MASLFIYENIQYQYVSGFIAEERWKATREAINGRFQVAGGLHTRKLFEQNKNAWRESFRQVIEEILAEIDAETN